MSYIKHEYKSGDKLYASDLNEMDEQIALNETNIGQLAQEIASYSNVSYGTCSTVAATAEKVVTVDNENWELKVGAVVMVKFTTSNSASNVKLNVNETGAYPIWYNNAEYTSTGTAYTGYANRVIGYMFNGTHWVWIMQSYDANTTYKNVTLGHGYATCTTAEATAAKVGTLSSYTLTVGGIVAVKFTYGVPASATLNINSKGAKAIYFRGAAITAGIIKAGDTATFIYNGSQYHLLSIDRWQNDIVGKADKATTLAGYGITDGATKQEVTQLQNTIANYHVSVKKYGAKGDGVTDDTQAFKNALAENDNVFVPKGDYLITDTLDISYKKSLYSDDGQRATIHYNGSNSVLSIGRLSVFRNINITLKNVFTGIVFDTNNYDKTSSTFGLESKVEHSNVQFNQKSTEATVIGITVDSGTDANNMPKLTGICYQNYRDITVGGSPYGYGIKMELIQGRPFTEETKEGFPWLTHVNFNDVNLGNPYCGIKATVTNTSGSEYFNRISTGHILFNNVFTQNVDTETTRYFLDLNNFSGYFTKCIAWDYHHVTASGLKVNIIGENVKASFSDCEMSFGDELLNCCDFVAEVDSGFTVKDSPSYFIDKYFSGSFLRSGYDSVDSKINAKIPKEYLENITEEKMNEILYLGYSNVLEDPLTQIKIGYYYSNSSQSWKANELTTTLIIPIIKGGNIIRYNPPTYAHDLCNGGMYFFNDDTLETGVYYEYFNNVWDSDNAYILVDNPNGYKYISIPFNYYTDISSETMTMTINREMVGGDDGLSYTEYLRKNVVVPTVKEEVNGNGFLTNENTETWTFILADGSTVTKKVVLA